MSDETSGNTPQSNDKKNRRQREHSVKRKEHFASLGIRRGGSFPAKVLKSIPYKIHVKNPLSEAERYTPPTKDKHGSRRSGRL